MTHDILKMQYRYFNKTNWHPYLILLLPTLLVLQLHNISNTAYNNNKNCPHKATVLAVAAPLSWKPPKSFKNVRRWFSQRQQIIPPSRWRFRQRSTVQSDDIRKREYLPSMRGGDDSDGVQVEEMISKLLKSVKYKEKALDTVSSVSNFFKFHLHSLCKCN